MEFTKILITVIHKSYFHQHKNNDDTINWFLKTNVLRLNQPYNLSLSAHTPQHPLGFDPQNLVKSKRFPSSTVHFITLNSWDSRKVYKTNICITSLHSTDVYRTLKKTQTNDLNTMYTSNDHKAMHTSDTMKVSYKMIYLFSQIGILNMYIILYISTEI